MSFSPKRSTFQHSRSSPSSKSQSQPAMTLTKSHKLEGDGLITGFYDFLLRNNKTMKPCEDVFIPDTIVYTNNFPRGWYTTEMERTKEVIKRQGTDLDSSKVYDFFKQPPSKGCGIVASYMSVHEEDDVVTTSVEFFNERSLKEFIERKNKHEGILQKFMIPKGGTRNTVIQAVWSPNPNAFFVWRRTNRMHLDNKPQWERDPYPMCVTYDGPSHYSEEGTVAGEVKKAIRLVCTRIKDHFFEVYEKEKVITRLVLYFKLDEHDQLWLMWCGGLRVADAAAAAAADPAHHPHMVPLNLAPRYTDSSVEAQRESHELELLSETNRKFRELKRSAAADKNSPNSKSHGDMHGSKGGSSHSPHHHGSAAGSPHTHDLAGGHSGSDMDGDEHHLEGGNGGGSGGAGSNGGSGAGGHADKDAWHKNSHVHELYLELCKSRDTVISYLDDIFYEAYGHFLRYDPGPFAFEVDKKIASLLGNDPLGEAMAAGGVSKATPSETGMASIDDEDLYFEIQPKHPKGPVSKIGDEVKKWVYNHYEKLILDMKEEAASMLPPLSSMGGASAAGKTSSSSPAAAAAASPAAAPAAGASSSSTPTPQSNAAAATAGPAHTNSSDEDEDEAEAPKPTAAPAAAAGDQDEL